MAPSPVITTSAARRRRASPACRANKSNPGCKSAPRNASNPNPSPPAAPAPGTRAKSLPELPLNDLRQATEATLGQRKVLWTQTLLRPVNPGRAARAKQEDSAHRSLPGTA